MKPTQLSQKKLEILENIDELVKNGQKKLESFETESAAIDKKWRKIMKTKQAREQNLKINGK